MNNRAGIFHKPKHNMKSKLALYMFVLVLLLLLFLAALLVLFGRFKTPKDTLEERLDTQATAFEKEIVTHRNDLSMLGIHLSKDAAELIGDYLSSSALSLEGLSGNESALTELQESLIEPVRQYLLQARCSGVFVFLNTSVGKGSGDSYSGIYLQTNGYETDRRDVILYRGISSVARSHEIMPHRQWRLEAGSDLIAEQSRLFSTVADSPEKAYIFSDIFTLPGTSEKATLLMLPMRGDDGTFYGICGFEISESYFKRIHAQSTKLSRFTGLITYDTGDAISSFLVCGSDDGYYYPPTGVLSVKSFDGDVLKLSDGSNTYLGMIRRHESSDAGKGFSSVVMTYKEDYDREAFKNGATTALIIVLLGMLSVAFCVYFSRRYLSPILRAIEQIKNDRRATANTGMEEINDLFTFLAERDSDTKSVIDGLHSEIAGAKNELARLQEEQEKTLAEYTRAKERLALFDMDKVGVSQEDYEHFVANLSRLTRKEREIFDLYLAGKSGKEIREMLDISENTLKYHNRHIYETLNVNSKKQLLTLAAMMEQKKEMGQE